MRWEERQHRDSSTSTLQGFGGPVLKQLLQHNVAGAITKHSRCAAALQMIGTFMEAGTCCCGVQRSQPYCLLLCQQDACIAADLKRLQVSYLSPLFVVLFTLLRKPRVLGNCSTAGISPSTCHHPSVPSHLMPASTSSDILPEACLSGWSRPRQPKRQHFACRDDA